MFDRIDINGPGHVKMCLMPYAISIFVVRCLDSMIRILDQSFKILSSFCS